MITTMPLTLSRPTWKRFLSTSRQAQSFVTRTRSQGRRASLPWHRRTGESLLSP